MTHADLFRHFPTAGFPAPRCHGELATGWTRSDTCCGSRPPAEHTVIKYTCSSCFAHLVLDATAGEILNSYQVPPVTQAARGLAGSPEG